MLDNMLTQEEIDAWRSGRQKNLVLTFSDGTVIDNNDIASESMSLEQPLCDESNLVFGKCSANVFKVRILSTTKQFKGLTVEPTISVVSDEGHTFTRKLGKFKVYSDSKTSNMLYRNLVCYDDLHEIINSDYADWYNSLTFPMTLKQFRDAFFSHVGIAQMIIDFQVTNDSITIEKTIEPSSLSGLTILESICEVLGCFGKINPYGVFRYVFLQRIDSALYPKNDLYPSDITYPRDSSNITLNLNDYKQNSLRYEDYTVQKITQLKISENDDDLGVIVGEEGNLYTITNNFLLYGKNSTELTGIANAILDLIGRVTYEPTKVTSVYGLPWIEVGDTVKVISDMNIVQFPILYRMTSGITALSDTFEAKGEEYQNKKLNSIQTSFSQLKSVTTKLTQTVNGIEIKVSDNEKATSELSQTVDGISSKVSADGISTTIEQTSRAINFSGGMVTFDTNNFKLDSNGNATLKGKIESSSGIVGGWDIGNYLYQTTNGYVAPTMNTMDAIYKMINGDIPIDLNYDMNGDGVVNSFDIIRCWRVILGLNEPSYISNIKKTPIEMKIDATNPEKALYLKGTNTWGEECEAYFGLNSLKTGRVEALSYLSSKTLDVKGNDTSQTTFNIQDSKGTYLSSVQGKTEFGLPVKFNNTVYNSSGGTVFVSDKNKKNSISELNNDKSSKFIYSLNPCEFKFNDGTSNRLHHGFIAQEVKESMGEDDWGVYVDGSYNSEDTTFKGLRYEEFIADLVATIQKQHEEIELLKEEVNKLKGE